MTLTPIAKRSTPSKGKMEPIFKRVTDDFNDKLARDVYEAVMKMDDGEAQEFVAYAVSDIVVDDIERNQRELQRHLDSTFAKRRERLQKTISKSLGEHEDAEKYLQALEYFSKATPNPYDYGYIWNEKDFNRDPSSGRFQTKVTHTQKKPINDKTAYSMGLPTSREVKGASKKNSDGKTKLDQRRIAAYQDEYRQLATFLGSVQASSANPGNEDILLQIERRNDDNAVIGTHTVRVEGTDPREAAKKWNPGKNERLIGIQAKPAGLSASGAAYSLMNAMGAGTAEQRMRATRTMASFDGQQYLDRMSDESETDPNLGTTRTFDRVKLGSDIAYNIAPNGTKIQAAAAMGQFVGQYGPEAEKVVGPSMRKTTYRYRGTQKDPEPELVREYQAALGRAERAGEFSEEDRKRKRAAQTRALNNWRVQQAERTGKPVEAIVVPDDKRTEIMNAAAARVTRERGSDKAVFGFDEREPGRAVVREYLWDQKRRPKQENYALQLASGNTPPSQGIIIDKDGKITAESVGYADDHYLPFNLKNLKGLRGGEYIRTRSVGGPTSEDIYTGLMSGARQVTVISRSGTFTVTFKEDFKGRRRYNDKAKRMTRRYEQILDAVQSEQVERESLPPEVRNGIRRQVTEEFGAYGMSPSEMKSEVDRRVREFKENPEFVDQDQGLIDTMAAVRSMAQPGTDQSNHARDVANYLAQQKEHKFRLNGPGYASALESLAEQFPYYIETDYRRRVSHDGIDLGEREQDKGYVEPGRNRPTEALGIGLYGTTLHQGLKRTDRNAASASNSGYQGIKGQRRLGTITPVAEPEKTDEQKAEEKDEKKSEQKGPETPEQTAERKIREKKKKLDYQQAAIEMQDEIVSRNPQFGAGPEGERSRAAYEKFASMTAKDLEDPSKAAAFDRFVDEVMSLYEANAARGGAGLDPMKVSAYKEAAGALKSTKYDTARMGIWTKEPQKFPEKAYEKDAPAGVVRKEKDGLVASTPLITSADKDLSQLDEDELRKEHNALRTMHAYLEDEESWKGMSAARRAEIMRLSGIERGAPGTRNMTRKELEKRMENVHRMRYLRRVHVPPETSVEDAKPESAKPVRTDDEQTRGNRPYDDRRVTNKRVQEWLEEMRTAREDLDEQATPESAEQAEALILGESALQEAMNEGEINNETDLAMLESQMKNELDIARRVNEARKKKKKGPGPTGTLRMDDEE